MVNTADANPDTIDEDDTAGADVQNVSISDMDPNDEIVNEHDVHAKVKLPATAC
jgi:hypothetical protein